jgi:hypothetical protein
MSLGNTILQKISGFRWRPIGYILLLALGGAIVSGIFYKPAKTNGMYLQELIDDHMLEKTAAGVITKLKASPETKNYTESDWKQMEVGLSGCFVKKATEYASSNDPYLSAPANMDTPTNLANRFLKACIPDF